MRQIITKLLLGHESVFKRNFFLPGGLIRRHLPLHISSRKIQTTLIYLVSAEEDHKEKREGKNEDEDSKESKEHVPKYALSTETLFNRKERNKQTFEAMICNFKKDNPYQRGVVEFIFAAVKHMEDYSVAYDIETYKKLIELMPEGKYVPENMWQREFQHYPKQQDCMLNLLNEMELKGVCPDRELVQLLVKRFGDWSAPVRKVYRQLYWMPKFKNANPWPIPFPPISDTFLLAKLAIERIVSVDPQSEISVWETKSVPDSIDETYIVSGQSPTQQRLLEQHPTSKSLHVEGPFRIWIGKISVNYFMLRGEGVKRDEVLEDPDDITNINIPFIFKEKRAVAVKPSVHEQEDITVLAVCASGTSSRDALLSWIRLLQKNGNPALEHIPVIFSLKAPVADVVSTDSSGPTFHEEAERLGDK